MESEDSTYPAHKRKLGDRECSTPNFPRLSSPSFEHLEEQQDGKDDQLLACPDPTIDPIQSTSERARERYLKGDPLALVLSPSSVECRQCKRKIKLSSKSAYDPFHWRNHRTRCMKAYKRKVKAMKKTSTFKKSWTPPLSASLHKDSLMHTPPLISDCDDDCLSDRSGELELANSPTTPSTSFAPPKQEFSLAYSSVDAMFNDYLRRSHPDYAQPPVSVPSAGRWRDWSWSQLKPPLFPVADDDNYDDDMDEDLPDSFDIFLRAAAFSLSFVSQR
ncbi:hypothetical protein BYT27DRAFT_6809986 [Phlegmacium glaucopus]|nr:hypothetical protein BYT27DRAFT_6809986 [Phlegmacium glaucopus]